MDLNHPPDVTDATFKANPHPFYALLRAEAPVYRLRLPDKRAAWLVTRYDDVNALLKDHRFAKNINAARPAEASTFYRLLMALPVFRTASRQMLDLDPPDHTRLRHLVQKVFSPRFIERLRQRIQDLADELLDRAGPSPTLDLVSRFALPLPATVIAEMLGVPQRDVGRFTRWSNRMLSAVTQTEMLGVVPTMIAFDRYIRGVIAQRRRHPSDDLIAGLVQAQDDSDSLSDDEIVAMTLLMLIAGHETTVNLIASGTLELIRHPEQLQRLRDEPTLMKPAIEELLRYTSPVDMATERYALEGVTIAGHTIPRGALTLGVTGSANRDQAQFPDADRLDLGRTPNRHLAFGQGPHYCLGAPLARMEAEIAFSTLLRRYGDLRLAVPDDQLAWRRGMTLRGLRSLPLVLTSVHPALPAPHAA